jgi:MFS family permease
MSLNRPLLGVNFFAGDVVAGLGPYLAIYLLSAYHWRPGGIGMALAIGSIASVLVLPPAGAIIDASSWKRGILGMCAFVIGLATALIVITHDPPWIVYTAQVMIGISCAFLAPCIAAITLGRVGPDRFTAQTSANQAWNHGGNVFAASLAAGLALWWSASGVFWLVIVMAFGMIICTLMIDGDAIDHDVARGGITTSGELEGQPSGIMTLLSDKRLLVFAVCVVMFHFANAAMLPLVSQKLATGNDTGMGIAFTSACIVAAQLVMIPMAVMCGAKADVWGRKALFLFAFAVLPFRGVLYTLSDNSYFLVGVQGMDGLANGIFGVVFLLILADVTHGTGRFNAAQGALTALIGAGSALSNLVAGWIVEFAGFSVGFLFLSATAILGGLLFAFLMPETAPHRIAANATSDPAIYDAT